MKNLLFAFSFIFVCTHLFAQTSNQLTQTDAGLKYAETITQSALKNQLTIIASREMEGRETGTAGQRKAAKYIKGQFMQIGLKPPPSLNSYLQVYPLKKDTLIPKSLKIGKTKYEFGKDYVVTPGSDNGQEFKSKEIVFAGYGITDTNYDDYINKDVKGKVVLVVTGEPKEGDQYIISGAKRASRWSFDLSKKASIAKQHGAVALLVVNPLADALSASLTNNSRSSNLSLVRADDTTNGKVPVVIITKSVAQKILNEQQLSSVLSTAKSLMPLNDVVITEKIKTKLEYKKINIPSESSNVIGYIEGSDKKDEYVFLTAHYDHLGKRGDAIYYGADDDGSGTVSVIEMAQAFAKAKEEGNGPRRSVVFMTVSGEEKGLWGSEYYSDHPVFPLENTTVDLNTDMVGRIDTERKTGDSLNYVYVIGHNKLSTDLPTISEGVNNKFTHLTLDYKYDDPEDKNRIYFRSDHYNFARKGVPILFFYDGMLLADYHKPTDTVDKINFDLMEKRVRFIFLTAWDMANRDDMVKRDLPLPTATR
ncbi:MAG: M28 family peptidase [Ginsengibacter sp.]